MSIHITDHAIARYQERVEPALNHGEAHAAILSHSKAIDAAVEFGAGTVILGCGARLVLCGCRVVTVLGRHEHVRKVGL
jgi:hypothetical protein